MVRRSTPIASVQSRRDAALNGVPYKLPVIRQKKENGKLHVTVELMRPRWQQMLGAEQTCEKTFALDDYGQQVYENCDGAVTVNEIVGRFAKKTKVSRPEAEMAVTKFLRTLLSKGLVAMQMEKPSA